MSTAPVTSDPYAAYGGQASSAADPYAAYGGGTVPPAHQEAIGLLNQVSQTQAHRLNMSMRQAQAIQAQNAPVDATSNATALNNVLPAAGMAVGGLAGGAIAGPVGAAAGAAFGGGAGKAAAQHAAGLDTNALPQVKDQAENAAIGAASEFIPSMLFKGAGKALDWLRPQSSPDVVPMIEQASRKLTNAINPNPAEANQFITNASRRVPDILEYAQRTGNPLNTRLEFSKAAHGASDEIRNYYDTNLLGPVADKQVSVAGSGYAGKTIGEGPNATLGAIDSRLADINQQLKPAYRQRNMGMVGSKLASEEDLQAEASSLRNILYKSLGKYSGMMPDAIGEIRSTFGSLKHLAEATDEAVTGRSLAAAKSTESGVGSVSTGALVGKGIDAARGKTDAIADRMFQRSLGNFRDALNVPASSANVPALPRNMTLPLAQRLATSAVAPAATRAATSPVPDQMAALMQYINAAPLPSR